MRFNDDACHGRADAAPFDVSGPGSCAADESLEYLLLLRGWNSHAVVADLDGKVVALARQLHLDRPAIRIILVRQFDYGERQSAICNPSPGVRNSHVGRAETGQ